MQSTYILSRVAELPGQSVYMVIYSSRLGDIPPLSARNSPRRVTRLHHVNSHLRLLWVFIIAGISPLLSNSPCPGNSPGSPTGAKLRYYGWGGELVLPNQKGISEVVPEGRTFDQSLINISFPKIVGEQSIFHNRFFLPLLLFNLRHSNIFKICPTKLYGYTRWDRDRGCHPPPPPHTHTPG
jgi:hypothetical protein